MSDSSTGEADRLDFLLENLVGKVPGTRSALLLTSDGLSKFGSGLSEEEADSLAAMASALCSLARGVGRRFGRSDRVRQVMAQLDDVVMYVITAGAGSVLATLAGPEADPGVLGYEMAQLVKQVPSQLSTSPRTSPVVGGGPR